MSSSDSASQINTVAATQCSSLCAIRDFDWSLLSGGEIYDKVSKRGARLGVPGNHILRKMMEMEIISTSASVNIARNRHDKEAQRNLFQCLDTHDAAKSMAVEVLKEYDRSQMSINNNSAIDVADINIRSGLQEGDISLNQKARIIHLVNTPEASALLEEYFSSNSNVPKAVRREILDDKRCRHKELWETIANDFYNNPCHEQTDSRVCHINPSEVPSIPLTRKNCGVYF